MDDLRDDFMAETRETLEILASQLVAWEKNPDDLGLIDSVFRFVHTVKGSCGFLDLPRLLKLSHAAENVLSAAREGSLTASVDLVSAVLAVIDRISALTNALETGESVHDNDHVLIETMLAFHSDNDLPELNHIDVGEGIEAGAALSPDTLDATVRSRTIRVSLQQLDTLMNGVSDLVLSRNELSRQIREGGDVSDIENALGRLSGTVAEVRDSVGMIRMQPIERLFASVPRLLRDISVQLGKRIEFIIEGGDVEIDREMLESLRDPVTHIIRNAADHGIETPEERIALGKNPVGRITISARQSGNQIIVEIRDDGRGIDLKRLGERVKQQKLPAFQQWNALSEKQKLDTIFSAGLSTAKTVTAISGRGVGMDVVRSNLHAVGAVIELENQEGAGFCIKMRLPLTLSIISGLSITAGHQVFALPRSAVVEILSVKSKNVRIEEVGGTKLANIRGERLIYTKLEDVLDVPCFENEGSVRSLVIVNPASSDGYALDVESVIDMEELVVKPCSPLIMASGFYAGTTLPDNGRPMLLLDASAIGVAIGASLKEGGRLQSVSDAAHDAKVENDEGISVLLFDGYDGQQAALPLDVIERMEDVNVEDIFLIDGRTVLSTDGISTELIGIPKIPLAGHVHVLKLFDGKSAKFLAIRDVVDIYTVIPDRSVASLSGFVEGIVHIGGKPVPLLSTFALFDDSPDLINGKHNAPLCVIESGADDHWERNILQPLLKSAGYAVSFNRDDLQNAQVILSSGSIDESSSDPRMIMLRDEISSPAKRGVSSIYRYDRLSLLSAIAAQVAGQK